MAKKEAEENQEVAEGEEAPKGKGGLIKIIILVVGLLVVIGATIGGTLYFSGFFEPKEVVETEVVEEEPKEEEKLPAQYYQLEPSFIINYQVRGRQRYLKADVAVVTRDPETFAALDEHSPLLKNRVLAILNAEIYEDLQTHEGRELLRQKVLQSVQETMQEELGKDEVEQVLFTNFVMQ